MPPLGIEPTISAGEPPQTARPLGPALGTFTILININLHAETTMFEMGKFRQVLYKNDDVLTHFCS